DRTDHGYFGGRHRIVLIMDRRRGAGEVEGRIDLGVEGKADIVAQEFKWRMGQEVSDIRLCTGEEIVDVRHFIAALDEPVDEMRADKACAARNEHPASQRIVTRHLKIPLCFPPSIGAAECFKSAATATSAASHFETARAAILAGGAAAR